MSDLKLEDLEPADRTALPYNHPLLDDYAQRIAAQLGVDPGLALGIKNAGERSGSTSVSSKKARGVMQTIPTTQAALGIQDPTDPLQSIAGGVKYLAQIQEQLGTTDPAVIAAGYHAGPDSRTVKGNFEGSPLTAAYSRRVADFVGNYTPPAGAGTPTVAPAAAPGLRPEDLTPEDLRATNPDWHDPTEGMSTGEKLAAGAGKFLVDTGSGLRQVAASVLNPVGQALTGKDVLNQDYEGEKERERLDSSLMKTGAGNVGYLGGSALTLAVPGGMLAQGASKGLPTLAALGPRVAALVAKYGPVAASAAGMASLTPTTKEGDRAVNMGTAAALGPVFAKGSELVGRAAKPVTDWVGEHVNLGPVLRKSWSAGATPEQRRVVGTAVRNEVPVYPTQLADPGSSVSPGRGADQLRALTRALNRTMGENTDDISRALADADRRLSANYAQVFNNKVIPLHSPRNGAAQGPFEQELLNIRRAYLNNTSMRRPDANLLDDIDRALGTIRSGGSIDGNSFQDMMRNYAASSVSAGKGNVLNGTVSDPLAARAYSRMATALENQAAPFMNPGDLALFRSTNRQFRSMKNLEAAAPIKVDGQADYTPAKLANRLARTDKGAFLYGKGDRTQSDLAKFGSTYMGLEANSPTGVVQRLKDTVRSAAPYVAGDAAGAVLVGSAMGTHDDPESSLASKLLTYGALAALTHGTLVGGRNALNPAVTFSQLSQPRGAVPEILRRVNPAPGLSALINREDEE